MEHPELTLTNTAKPICKATLRPEWRRELLRLFWLLLFPLAFLLVQLASISPIVVETVYSKGIFPAISSGVSKLFGWIPFSFAELLVYVLLALLLIWIVYTIVHACKKSLRAVRLVRTLITYAIVVAVSMNVFYWFWGFNYYRMPLAYTMNLEVKERPAQELADLCVSLAAAANTLREQVPEDANGVFTFGTSTAELFREIPQAYGTLGKQYPQFGRSIPPAKPVLSSELMSVAGISGIFIPFTQEANINTHQPPLLIPSAAAHESAHLLGIAREDEANFVGYLACLQSQNKSVQYSGIVLALINAGNALDAISPSAYSQLFDHYSIGLQRDLIAHSAYWKQYEGQAEQTVSKINDNYLKQHNQSDGIMSYGRMVDLLLAYYAQ